MTLTIYKRTITSTINKPTTTLTINKLTIIESKCHWSYKISSVGIVTQTELIWFQLKSRIVHQLKWVSILSNKIWINLFGFGFKPVFQTENPDEIRFKIHTIALLRKLHPFTYCFFHVFLFILNAFVPQYSYLHTKQIMWLKPHVFSIRSVRA